MKGRVDEVFLEKTVQRMLKNRSVFGAVLAAQSGDSSLSWTGSAGYMHAGDRYFVASVTKLYVTAVMLMLRQEGKLDFTDPVTKFFPSQLIDGIHVLKGTDYTGVITVAHLMSNTSGIPDYFYYDKPKGEAAAGLLTGHDEPWPLDRAVERAKALPPKFAPGRKNRVHYSDTNYQLLGGIIESVTGRKLADVFREYLFQPLNLKDTYAYQDINDTTPSPFYYKTQVVHAPKYMASVTAEGGIVSTAEESLAFLKAFFTGFFFPREVIQELTNKWNMIFFPGQFYFGLGIEKLWTPRILFPGKPIGDLLGFWGQTGSFAFHSPGKDLFFTGTVNQASGFGHSAAFRAMIRIVKSF